MTVTVNFENPQVQVVNGSTGIAISQVILPYSIRKNEDALQYLGGQTVLTKEDGVAFTDNTADWYKKALVKIKDMVASSEIYKPDVAPVVDTHDASSEVAQSVIAHDVAPVAQATDTPDVTHATPEAGTPDAAQVAQV